MSKTKTETTLDNECMTKPGENNVQHNEIESKNPSASLGKPPDFALQNIGKLLSNKTKSDKDSNRSLVGS